MRLFPITCLTAMVAAAGAAQVPELYFFGFPLAAAGRAVHEQAVAALEAAGWWDYVRSNADRIEYHNSFKLDPPPERAAGCAMIVGRARVMAVAVRGRTAQEIGRIMVHEAAHLEHWRRHGRFDRDQSWANMRERQFRQGHKPDSPGDSHEFSVRYLNRVILLGALVWAVLLVLWHVESRATRQIGRTTGARLPPPSFRRPHNRA